MSLGVEVDFGLSLQSVILLRNKPGRVHNIGEIVADLLKPSAVLGFKEALSLRGRVAFAEGIPMRDWQHLWRGCCPGGLAFVYPDLFPRSSSLL